MIGVAPSDSVSVCSISLFFLWLFFDLWYSCSSGLRCCLDSRSSSHCTPFPYIHAHHHTALLSPESSLLFLPPPYLTTSLTNLRRLCHRTRNRLPFPQNKARMLLAPSENMGVVCQDVREGKSRLWALWHETSTSQSWWQQLENAIDGSQGHTYLEFSLMPLVKAPAPSFVSSRTPVTCDSGQPLMLSLNQQPLSSR